MENELKTLQLYYSVALLDCLKQYEKNNILEKVTFEKNEIQKISAKGQLSHLGINSIENLYNKFAKIFGCANWELSQKNEEFISYKTSTCLLCSLAKKQGAPMPCDMFCINPFKSLAKELGYNLEVKETLWSQDKCIFQNKKL